MDGGRVGKNRITPAALSSHSSYAQRTSRRSVHAQIRARRVDGGFAARAALQAECVGLVGGNSRGVNGLLAGGEGHDGWVRYGLDGARDISGAQSCVSGTRYLLSHRLFDRIGLPAIFLR